MLVSADGYLVAPAFDLAADISARGEHTPSIHHGFTCPDGAELIAVAAEWGVTGAPRIMDEVIKATASFTAAAHTQRVWHPRSLERICEDIYRRRRLLGHWHGGLGKP